MTKTIFEKITMFFKVYLALNFNSSISQYTIDHLDKIMVNLNLIRITFE